MFTKSNRSRIATVLAVAFGLVTFAMPAQAAPPQISIVTTAVSGGTVQVTVKNTTTSPVTATVAVEAIVSGTATWSVVPVVLLGGQCATVSAGFTGSVSKTLSVGIQDDYTPF